jgi:hypothetical protein
MPTALLAAAGVVFLGCVVAPVVAGGLRTLDVPARARRAGMMAAALGAISLPMLAVVAATSTGSVLVVSCAGFLLAVAAYALMQVAVVVGTLWVVAAALWFAAPPFLFYLVLEMYAVRPDVLLLLSPVSAAVRAAFAGGACQAFGAALVVPAIAGAAASVLPARETGSSGAPQGAASAHVSLD